MSIDSSLQVYTTYMAVVWKNKDEGILTTEFSVKTVFSQRYGLKLTLLNLCNVICRDCTLLRDILNGRELYVPGAIHCYMWQVYPERDKERLYMKKDKILEVASRELIKLIDKNLDIDALFLAGISRKRDWSHDCAICLRHKIGEACSCGHTKIVMFRPCGHTMCQTPCFREYYQTKTGTSLPMKTMQTEEEIFYIPGSIEVKTSGGFECPVCRVTVSASFDTNDMYISETLLPLDNMIIEILYT